MGFIGNVGGRPYWFNMKKGIPIAVLMELFNHSNQAVTKLYLRISQDDMDDVYRLVEL